MIKRTTVDKPTAVQRHVHNHDVKLYVNIIARSVLALRRYVIKILAIKLTSLGLTYLGINFLESG